MDLSDLEPSSLQLLDNALRTLDPKRSVGHRGQDVEPAGQPEFWSGRIPHAAWPYHRNGRPAGWVVYDQEVLPLPHPGTSVFGLTHFGAEGVVAARGVFDTGYRRYVRDARLRPVPQFAGPVAVVETNRFPGRPDWRYYTPVGDRFELVRHVR